MGFEHDFFISYAHLDDEALIAGEQGWMQGNDIFADTLVERLPRIAALVSVLSPRYVRGD